MRKLTLFLLIATSFFASSQEEWTQVPSHSWQQDGTVMMVSLNEEDETGRFLVAQAQRNLNGKLSMYFNLIDTSRDTCNYRKSNDINNTNQHKIEGVIIQKFNGQPIKMNGFCVKESKDAHAYIYLTPESDLGKTFVVNVFTKNNNVLVETDFIDGFEKVSFTALGFSKFWNKENVEAL
ncbi:hypothetical protein AB3A93_003828 [Vibrio parahaemolyticus]|uniref:hypothetical protein n=1 Tax=Vibrio parahaemolyticus TaxID=670 RepID=UPI00084AC2C0|nr:hypothetical protein [Vibrio parahaemolyticus]EGQ8035511.1 hypothetical protein [Vibrio parahaemolyticus]EHD2278804.1 hypothetical protein [Vibrio parahaemolyticus]EHH2494576.1 hypothetical protein [Vibrio parahaemolyticus]EHR0871781.1 hypothetical protein [Vibrio parahaemolyticus]EID4325764.1 hypothetical protein [Vibrio parahaemolyticus]